MKINRTITSSATTGYGSLEKSCEIRIQVENTSITAQNMRIILPVKRNPKAKIYLKTPCPWKLKIRVVKTTEYFDSILKMVVNNLDEMGQVKELIPEKEVFLEPQFL